MSRSKAFATLGALAIGLSGCANLDYAVDEYGSVPLTQFEYGDHPYRVFDKPTANRLMITSSLGSALGGGFIRGLTLGLVSNHPSEPTMHQVAEAFLAQSGRNCQVQPGQLIAEPQWEFRYSCASGGLAIVPGAGLPQSGNDVMKSGEK